MNLITQFLQLFLIIKKKIAHTHETCIEFLILKLIFLSFKFIEKDF